MQKHHLLTAMIFSVWGLFALCTSALTPQIRTVSASIPDDPDIMPPGAVGSYTLNGTFHWLVPGSDAKIINFSGMSREDIFEKIKMSPEGKAKIVHQVPPTAEVVIDGVTYKSEDIHLFDGHQLGFTIGKDRRLYAFTTEEGFQAFKQEQLDGEVSSLSEVGTLSVDIVYSHYYEAWYLGGAILNLHYQSSLASMPQGWDNIISSLEVNTSCYATRLYDYADFGGDYFEALAGTTYNVIWTYGWNDRASSLLHY